MVNAQTPVAWEALANTIERLLADNPARKVSDPLCPEVRAAILKLTDAIANPTTGIDQRDAEYAVTQWLIEQKPIGHCVTEQQTDEARAMRKPR